MLSLMLYPPLICSMLYARTKRIIIIFGKARRHKLLLVVSLPPSLYAPLSPSLCKPTTTPAASLQL